jgi:hypothetical protein
MGSIGYDDMKKLTEDYEHIQKQIKLSTPKKGKNGYTAFNNSN